MELKNGFEIEERAGFTIVRPVERLGMQEADFLAEALNPLLARTGAMVAVDLGQVEFISSRSLGVLMAAHSTTSRRKGRLVLGNIQRDVGRVLRVTRVDTVFEIVDDIEAMLQRFQTMLEDKEAKVEAQAASGDNA